MTDLGLMHMALAARELDASIAPSRSKPSPIEQESLLPGERKKGCERGWSSRIGPSITPLCQVRRQTNPIRNSKRDRR